MCRAGGLFPRASTSGPATDSLHFHHLHVPLLPFPLLSQGYRDAQCGWSLPPDGHPWARHGLLLVLYAPRRELLEVWTPRSGVRVSAARVEAFCRLLPVAAPCGGWGNELMGRWQAHSVPSTVVLRLGGKEKGALWDVLELGLRG